MCLVSSSTLPENRWNSELAVLQVMYSLWGTEREWSYFYTQPWYNPLHAHPTMVQSTLCMVLIHCVRSQADCSCVPPGHRLKGRDVLHAGVATHFITKDKVSDCIIICAHGDNRAEQVIVFLI